MKERKVISGNNIPVRIPVIDAIVLYLLLDKFNAAAWIWGVVGTLWAIMFIATLIATWNEKSIDIFKEDKK